eukprot:CAMPEP_0167758900 /NCGR_PEP_ID=MMETSP0110_2-20121227/10727_1 /TAXON_ID=629695 /ORGANISM="Gymnochlora sp., Strain CCMP2014" /LENGTH=158 /DNA_ID=CAMNT_0007645231 /DNA_START=39 /DNA_END=515 /DNA_ORIENTATION=-
MAKRAPFGRRQMSSSVAAFSEMQHCPPTLRSTRKLRTCRMIRKMIKEIFGHPNVPAEGEVVAALPPKDSIVVAIIPEDSALDIKSLRLSYPVRPIRDDECHDMMMYTAAKVRIDRRLLPYYPHAYDHLLVDESLKYWNDGHVLFGDFAQPDTEDSTSS